ncbi:MAG: hypothetical protein LBG83_06415 [Oscillospiraceae bacterium]|jgi:hypothetical protein|nr:hypothetical protein [Oscillospiraceae bacterium]
MKLKLRLRSLNVKNISPRGWVILLLSVVLLGSVTAGLAITFAAPTELGVSLRWAGDDSSISHNGLAYNYAASEEETRLLRLAVGYDCLPEQDYGPGDVRITLQGLKEIFRTGEGFPSAIAADAASAAVQEYAWSYTYVSGSDTFTFYNNNAIAAGERFQGDFELLWDVNSAESKELSISRAARISAGGSQVLGNELIYSATRQKDSYSLTFDAAQRLNSYEGLAQRLPAGEIGTSGEPYTAEGCTFVSYTLDGQFHQYLRSLEGPMTVKLFLPKFAALLNGNFTKTAEVQGGGGYDNCEQMVAWTTQISVTAETSRYWLKDLIVAYPMTHYYQDQRTVTAECYGAYQDGGAAENLANASTHTQLANFEAILPPTEQSYRFSVSGEGEHSAAIDAHCAQCAASGAILKSHMNDGTEYGAAFQFSFTHAPSVAESYNVSITVPEIRVSPSNIDPSLYDLLSVEIPANTDILNLNGLPIAAGVYSAKIFADGALADTVLIGAQPQTISLPAHTKELRMDLENLAESIADSVIMKVRYRLNVSETSSDALGLRAVVSCGPFGSDDYTLLHHILDYAGSYSVEGKLTDADNTASDYGMSADVAVKFDKAYAGAQTGGAHVTVTLPEGVRLPDWANTPAALQNLLQLSDNCTIVLEESAEGEKISFLFDDAGAKEISIRGIPLLYDRALVTDVSKELRLLVEASLEGNSYWHSLNAADISASVRHAAAYVKHTLYNPPHSTPGLALSAQGYHAGFVIPALNENDDYPQDVPVTYQGQEYQYKLALQAGGQAAHNLSFTLRSDGPRGKWNGTLISVDSSAAQALLGCAAPVVTDNGTDVVVEFPSGATLPAGETLYVIFQMQAPAGKEQELADDPFYIAEYKGTAAFAGGAMESNYAPVRLSADGGTLALRVADEADGRPVAGIELSLRNSDGVILRSGPASDANGLVQFAGLPSGTYSIGLAGENHKGYEAGGDVSYTIGATLGEYVSGTVPLQRKTAAFSAVVVNAGNETVAVPGVAVQIEGAGIVKTTGADGVVTFDAADFSSNGLPWGDHHLVVASVPAGYKAPKNPKTAFAVNAENDAGRLLELRIAIPQEPAQAALTVKDESDVPAAGVVYALYLEQGTAKRVGLYTTDSAGSLIAEELAYGNYYFQQFTSVKGYKTSPAKIEFTLSPAENSAVAEAQLQQVFGIISLRKLDEDSQPIPGAVYGLFAGDNTAFDQPLQTRETDADGKFAFDPVPWGDYCVKELVPAPGHGSDSAVYNVTIDRDNCEEGYEIITTEYLEKGQAQLKLTAKSGGAPVPNAEFALYKDGALHLDNLLTDANGLLTVAELPWGSYYFQQTAAPDGFGLAPGKIPFVVNVNTAGVLQKLAAAAEAAGIDVTATRVLNVAGLSPNLAPYVYRLTVADRMQYLLFDSAAIRAAQSDSAATISRSAVFANLPVAAYHSNYHGLSRADRSSGNVAAPSSPPYESREDTFLAEPQPGALSHYGSAAISTKTYRAGGKQATALSAVWHGGRLINAAAFNAAQLEVRLIYDDGSFAPIEAGEYGVFYQGLPLEQATGLSGIVTLEVQHIRNGTAYTASFDVEFGV